MHSKEALGTGRRKSAVAQVKLISGTGRITINERPGVPYLQYNPAYLWAVQGPLDTLGLEHSYDTMVKTKGGGLTGQAEAIQLGVARALCKLDTYHRQPLKIEGYLTRNPLRKERKKYGLKKARKAPQFSKR
uniref:Small ribosomal subunit protein uS9c n=1 Tax=Nephroselmis astigmatica TaxID=259378 RepID=A0A088CJF9_9CHLO|nr:ribosomal protein S9 [Nephroselmis astigmatica]AID67736.1 ribosomal protein S9 [Nephroselmis astigmatica]